MFLVLYACWCEFKIEIVVGLPFLSLPMFLFHSTKAFVIYSGLIGLILVKNIIVNSINRIIEHLAEFKWVGLINTSTLATNGPII